MKVKNHILVFGILLASLAPGLGQSDLTFTKITEGPVATNRGYSYSCAWGDYDNDGFSDLFVINGAYVATTANYLYRNNGDGTFARMTTNDVGSVVSDRAGWRGGAWGDYDNDGFLDLYVTQDYGLKFLYKNTVAGRFTRITTNGPLVTETGYGDGVSWGDYDRDGLLDLFVVTASSGYHGYTGSNSLFHNKGDGTFSKITSGPVATDLPQYNPGFGPFGGAWADFDNDGDQDLVVGAGGSAPRWVYRNDGAGQFSKITTGTLAADIGSPLYHSWGDYDNDGLLDLFSASWGAQSRLFHNDGGGQFTRILLSASQYEAKAGAWGDYDNDGYLDLYIAMGASSGGNNLLYHNNGNGTFTRITTGNLVTDGGHSTCAAWCDYDNNGFLDLFVANWNNEVNCLYRNNGNTNGWLMFKLLGTKSNRAAIGAKVRIMATVNGTNMWQMREISGGSGYQDDLRPHFGLGDATNVDLVRIEWPSGIIEEFTNFAPRQLLTIVEPGLKGSLGQEGKFHVSMTMSTNRVYQLQTSSDLVTWTALTNCTGSGSCAPVEYVDTETPAVNTKRFYRLQ